MKIIKRKFRILFLFAYLHKGGMQRAVSNISLALPDDFEQYVAFFGTENPPFKYNAILHDFNIPGSLKFSLFSKIKNIFLRIYRLRMFVRAQKIDVVISFGEAANLLNILSFNSAYRILCIRSAIGGYGIVNFYDNLYRGVIRFSYPFSNLIVAVSEDLKKQIEVITGQTVPVRQIPNLYHLNMIQKYSKYLLPEEFNFLTKSPYLLNVGSMVAQKGQYLLIESFAKIAAGFPDLQLVLIGHGPEKDNYAAQAAQLGVGNRVIFIDFDENPYRYMRLATVFVLPSLTEGFPNVLVEAMACGCPVVAFDCQTGPREILGDSVHGELVEKITAEDLAVRLHELLSSKEKLLHFKEQATIRAEYYGANRVIGEWVDILAGGL